MSVRLCFVCLGNICRSPTAEGVFRHLLAQRGESVLFEVESAGTGAYHEGESPDHRSRATAAQRGISLEGAAARFDAEDFGRFDWVVAMDGANKADLLARARSEQDAAKVVLLREWDADSEGPHDLDVPDPYYGGASGFDDVLDICIRSCKALLEDLEARARA